MIVRVAVNVPLSRLFDYRVPKTAEVTVGCRVEVPFGTRTRIGIVIELADRSDIPTSKLKIAARILDTEPLFRESDLWLIRFVSNYYHHPVGEVASAAMPALLRQGKPLDPVVQYLSLTAAGREHDLDIFWKRAPRQAALLATLRDADTVSFPDLDEELPGWKPAKKSLLNKGLAEEFESSVAGSEGCLANIAQETGPELNSDQRKALAVIRNSRGFAVKLIDGVTGSGKTEVYLHLIASELEAGRQVLVVVPEIGLTPQLVHRFGRRLGLEPMLLHSGLSDTERLQSWRSARSGAALLVVGTRSAIFTPLQNPGLIIVDEEHDPSLKQQEGLRYSARDLAVARGKHLDIPVVLGTATPSLETLQRCRESAYQPVELPVRAGIAVPPLLKLVDLTRYDAVDGLSQPVVNAIEKNNTAGGQTLVFLNRRGFAPTLICTGCGKIAECGRCDSRMTVHATSNTLRCHHCGAERAIEADCLDCGAAYRALGHGTERLEDVLKERFPTEVIARVDSDSTRLKGTMSKALAMATTGETRILVGTQMLSKGHHFPDLSLVVIINADQGLFSTDFRGAERLAQSLVQVSGRAGREERQGEVIIQTAFPDHPFWAELFAGGYRGVAERELTERKKSLWPPFSKIALIRASSPKRADAHAFLALAHQLAGASSIDNVRLLGPVRAPMERRAGRYRAQLLLQSVDRRSLHAMLAYLRTKLEGSKEARRVRWSVDVDPIELF